MPKIEIVNEASEHFYEKSKLFCERSEQALRRSYQNLARSANFLLVNIKKVQKQVVEFYLVASKLGVI